MGGCHHALHVVFRGMTVQLERVSESPLLCGCSRTPGGVQGVIRSQCRERTTGFWWRTGVQAKEVSRPKEDRVIICLTLPDQMSR